MDSRPPLEKDLRRLNDCEGTFSMSRQNKFNVGKEENEAMGKYK